ncbi:MAG TPA: alpha/beta fold hydrolase [Steroidobacteraceae bacterium]
MSFQRPRAEPLRLPGPGGVLQALLEDPHAAMPPGQVVSGFGVVCHPHPLYGGTMINKVVHTLARALQEQGLPTLRFNYRGVEQSEGQYDGGRGETADALAVIAWGRERWPQASLTLAGFSFGAMIALRAAPAARPARLITVAPPVTHEEFGAIQTPSCPWLIVQGEADEVVDHRQVAAFAARFSPPPVLRLLPGVDHFFNGRLAELREAVLQG